MKDYSSILRQEKREELALRFLVTFAEEDVPEDEPGDDAELPSDEELEAGVADASPEEITEYLLLVRELLEDKAEDITPEERKSLTEIHDTVAKKINEDNAGNTEAAHLCQISFEAQGVEEFRPKFCWGRPCDGGSSSKAEAPKEKKPKEAGNLRKRARSLKPRRMLDDFKTRNVHSKGEYKFGKYNYNYIPKTESEAKHKVSQLRSSKYRWAAAAVVSAAAGALVPKWHGFKAPKQKFKSRRAELKEAKGQRSRLKIKRRDRTSASSDTLELNMKDYSSLLRQERREELAGKVWSFADEDAADDAALAEYPSSAAELKAKAANLTEADVRALLPKIRQLIADSDADNEKQFNDLVGFYNGVAAALNKGSSAEASVEEICEWNEDHFIDFDADTEVFERMCWCHPCKNQGPRSSQSRRGSETKSTGTGTKKTRQPGGEYEKGQKSKSTWRTPWFNPNRKLDNKRAASNHKAKALKSIAAWTAVGLVGAFAAKNRMSLVGSPGIFPATLVITAGATIANRRKEYKRAARAENSFGAAASGKSVKTASEMRIELASRVLSFEADTEEFNMKNLRKALNRINEVIDELEDDEPSIGAALTDARATKTAIERAIDSYPDKPGYRLGRRIIVTNPPPAPPPSPGPGMSSEDSEGFLE